MTVDLEQQTIVCGNRTYNFSIDPVRRMRLLNGWDDIALTESYRDRIAAFKADDRARRPWANSAPGLKCDFRAGGKSPIQADPAALEDFFDYGKILGELRFA